MRQIAISDIHGCALTFRRLVEDVVQLSESDHLLLLGDYIDRGPDSRSVIDYIFELQEAGFEVTCLKGNHEDMILQSRFDQSYFDMWFVNGGEATLNSFGVQETMNEIPSLYWHFFNDLLPYSEVEGGILVHAGLNFSKEDPFSDLRSMLWIRHWYDSVRPEWLDNRIVVHGHTPMRRAVIEGNLDALDEKLVLGIDSGCYAYGDLCAFDLTNRQLYFQPNLDMDSGPYWG